MQKRKNLVGNVTVRVERTAYQRLVRWGFCAMKTHSSDTRSVHSID